MKNMKNLFLLLNMVLVSALMVACAGDSSDPLEKYNDLKGIPQHTETSDKQSLFHEHPFIIKIEGGSSESYGDFVAGKEGKASIRVIANNNIGSDLIKLARVDILNFPNSEKYKLSPSTKDPQLYQLTWTPSPTFTQGVSSKKIDVTVRATSSDGLQEDTVVTLTVTKSGKIPRIVEASFKNNVVKTEGDTFEFYLDIKDEDYIPGGVEPILNLYPYESPDDAAYRADLFSKISVNPKYKRDYLGGNVFRFYRVAKLKDIENHRDRHNKENPGATSLDMCFWATAENQMFKSMPNLYCITVNYLAQTAKVKWATEGELKVVAGKEEKIQFTISTENGLSTLSIETPTTAIKNLSGTKKLIKLDGENDKVVTYELQWKPACGAANIKKYPLAITALSSLNGRAIKTPISKEIEVIDSEENCAVKNTPAKKETAPRAAKPQQGAK